MERHIQRFLNKVSLLSITIATITLLFLFLQTPETCIPHDTTLKPHLRFPKSTCDSSPRHYLPLPKKNTRLWSSKSWITQVSSFTQLFTQLYKMGLLKKHSKVLCVSAGAGHEVMALSKMGVEDVTGVEVIESLPLVSKADPHNLPFFDGAFDVAFTGHLVEALYPRRYAGEMERTVREGGVCVVVVDECGDEEVKEIVWLFRRSRLVGTSNVTLNRRRVTRIILRTIASA
ncbi:S-adenosyl-L-methionine-dependent methyltransferases superfamily protein, putative [Theobroma cacao]|uniref:S-adenosyl-L-methionine-dependent methyltransferases superfamily protein, putative n=1 Tax=Theobroma cacao TaxID=3641 RepID=A0A061FQF1_THECC|nr:S-adenosyl-L-methionine-dependent methyltransferases superfamily protein, putative [Theobroma cacao]